MDLDFKWNYHKGIFIAPTGAGKTHLVINQYLPLADRLMICDSNMEIASQTGLKYTRNIKEWSPDCPCYFPKEYSIKELERVIKRVRNFTNVLFFCDDVDLMSGGQYYAGQEIINLMINGRHQNLGVLLSYKVPNNIDKRIIQNVQLIHLWTIEARYLNVIKDWNESLNHPNPEEFLNLETHTFGLFAPRDRQNPNATSPKEFLGYYRL